MVQSFFGNPKAQYILVLIWAATVPACMCSIMNSRSYSTRVRVCSGSHLGSYSTRVHVCSGIHLGSYSSCAAARAQLSYRYGYLYFFTNSNKLVLNFYKAQLRPQWSIDIV